jgi:hypothetical protein
MRGVNNEAGSAYSSRTHEFNPQGGFISKKDRQHNGQKKKDKQRSTKHTHETKDQVTAMEKQCST